LKMHMHALFFIVVLEMQIDGNDAFIVWFAEYRLMIKLNPAQRNVFELTSNF